MKSKQKRHKSVTALFVFVGLIVFATSSYAQILNLPSKGITVKTSADVPQRGQSIQMVEANHGTASNIQTSRGTPPITVWEYPTYKVYFESGIVLHTVITP